MSGGVGRSNLGTGPYGYGSIPLSPRPADQVFTLPVSGAVASCRKIDPVTKQYVYDTFGRIAGDGTVPQLVYLAYATVKGSSILADLGEQFSDVQTVGDGFEDLMRAYATEPIQSLIDAGKLELIGIDITRPNPDAVVIVVTWKDLSTGREGSTTL